MQSQLVAAALAASVVLSAPAAGVASLRDLDVPTAAVINYLVTSPAVSDDLADVTTMSVRAP